MQIQDDDTKSRFLMKNAHHEVEHYSKALLYFLMTSCGIRENLILLQQKSRLSSLS